MAEVDRARHDGTTISLAGHVPMDGVSDDAAYFSQFSDVGGYAIPAGKTFTIKSPITNKPGLWLLPGPESTVKVGAELNGTTVFTQSVALGPNQRTGVYVPVGRATLDLTSVTGATIFDLHSPQFCKYLEGFDITAAGDQTGTLLKLRCDVAITGGLGNNKNATDNIFGGFRSGKQGTVYDISGAALTSQVVTLNTFLPVNCLNVGVVFMTLGDYFDNNIFSGVQRCSLNQNSAIGVHLIGASNTYAEISQIFQIDTFAGKTLRKAIVMEAGASRHEFYLFNDPVAEGGAIVDNGALSYDIHGDWQASNAASSSIMRARRNNAPATSRQVIAYTSGVTMAIDAGLIGEIGECVCTVTDATNYAFSNPTNASDGQVMTFRVINGFGNTLGVQTLPSKFIIPTFTKPAAGQQTAVTMRYDGTNWNAVGPVVGPF